MLFKVSAALVLGLLSIASSASPKKAAIERGQQQAVNNIPTVGSTAVTLLPLDRETVGAGKLFRMRTIGFERADLRTYGLDVILKTANGLNTLTLAQDLASNNASGDNEFDVIFRAPSVFNIRRSEVGQNILANVQIWERDMQEDRKRIQAKFLAQSPFIVLHGAGTRIKGE